jgi:hypothetical protein
VRKKEWQRERKRERQGDDQKYTKVRKNGRKNYNA